jgi:hypothetical protein
VPVFLELSLSFLLYKAAKVSIDDIHQELHLEYQYNFHLKLLAELDPLEIVELNHQVRLVAKFLDEVAAVVVLGDQE